PTKSLMTQLLIGQEVMDFDAFALQGVTRREGLLRRLLDHIRFLWLNRAVMTHGGRSVTSFGLTAANPPTTFRPPDPTSAVGLWRYILGLTARCPPGTLA